MSKNPAPIRSKLAPKGTDAGRHYGGKGKSVRWKPKEWCLIVRRVDHWRSRGSRLADVRLVMEAQEIELQADRRRPINSISAGGSDELPRQLAVAREKVWMVNSVPFDPVPMTPAVAASDILPIEPPIRDPGPPPDDDEVEPPEPIGEPPPWNEPEAATSADPVPAAIQAAPSALSAPTGLARAFADRMAESLEILLAAQRQEARAEAHAALRQEVAGIADSIAALVLAGIDRALGGPGNVPQPEPEPELAFHASPPKLQVDVVGMSEVHQEHVRARLNGHERFVTLHFVSPKATHWKPQPGHRVLVTSGPMARELTKTVSRLDYMPVKRTPAAVLKAINTMVIG